MKIKLINNNKNWKSNGIIEIISLITILIVIFKLFLFISAITLIYFIPDVSIPQSNIIPQSIENIYQSIKYLINIQIGLTSISLIIHKLDKNFGSGEHKILLVGTDYYDLLRGKELHSLKIIRHQVLKVAFRYV